MPIEIKLEDDNPNDASLTRYVLANRNPPSLQSAEL